MMKKLLSFLLFALLASCLLFSCASDEGEAASEDLPAVEAADTEEAAVAPAEPEPDAELSLLPEPLPQEELPAEPEPEPEPELPAADDDLLSEEPDVLSASDDDMLSEALAEFIPVEDAGEEAPYTLDVATYYDGFAISEDDFVAVEVPEPAPEPAAVSEPEPVPVAVSEELVPEKEIAKEELSPEMEQLYIPSPREDMKKPVAVISEEAAGALSVDEEELLSAVDEILAEIPEPEEQPEPVPSRSITVQKNDVITVPYQGNWWVYLGDSNGSNALAFSGRDYVSEKTVFTLRAQKEGVAMLHFFKQDIIAGVMVDDYLEITVDPQDGPSERIELDMFVISQIKPVPPEAEESEWEADEASAPATTAPAAISSGNATAPAATSPVTASTPAATSSGKANAPAATSSGKANAPALTSPLIVDESDVVSYVERDDVAGVATSSDVAHVAHVAPVLTDAELFARAQELEATDIEEALSLYKQLVSTYPTSPYWTQANKRITYINRFYFFKR